MNLNDEAPSNAAYWHKAATEAQAENKRLRGERAVMAQWIKTACEVIETIAPDEWEGEGSAGEMIASGMALAYPPDRAQNTANDLLAQPKDTTE